MCEGDVNLASGSVTTTGGAGASTGTTTINCMSGWLESIQLDYNAAAPASTVVAFTQADSPTVLLTTTATATDATHYVRAACVNTAMTAIGNSAAKIWVHGPVLVTVTLSNDLAPAVTAYIVTSG
jgi:hypothetical protein